MEDIDSKLEVCNVSDIEVKELIKAIKDKTLRGFLNDINFKNMVESFNRLDLNNKSQAIEYALVSNNIDAVEFLLENGAKPTVISIKIAILKDKEDILKKMIDKYPFVKSTILDDFTYSFGESKIRVKDVPLSLAIRSNKNKIVKFLLDQGANYNQIVSNSSHNIRVCHIAYKKANGATKNIVDEFLKKEQEKKLLRYKENKFDNIYIYRKTVDKIENKKVENNSKQKEKCEKSI